MATALLATSSTWRSGTAAQQIPLAAPSLQIIAAPATPTSANATGPPIPALDSTAYPVPSPPSAAIGTTQLNLAYGQGDAPIYPGIPVLGNFLGLSIELSVVDEIIGKTSQKLNISFLNYISALATRSGMGPILRIGGNTQDTAIYNATSTVSTDMIVKVSDHGYTDKGVPVTPSIEYNDLVFQAMQSLAQKLNTHFVWGLNMVNHTASFTELMVKTLNRYISDHVDLILVGNEPDRYPQTGNRPSDYDIPTYLDEWGDLTGRVMGDLIQPKLFTAPNVCCGWTTFSITEENGMRERFKDRLKAISAIQYPQSLCSSNGVQGHEFYLNHTNTVTFAQYDADAIAAAVANQIPYYLVETNTASCIGINGVSNAFTSAIWGVDAALQLAYRNHTGVFWHTSGINTIYNVFTPPAYNATTKSWKTGPIYYSSLVVAEALASQTNSSQVLDLQVDRDDASAYAIFENTVAKKVVLINMINDASGANTWTANIPAQSGQTTVSYKLLAAQSVDSLDGITWANQTFGYWSDGVLQGAENIKTAACNDGQCPVQVPAPGVALVFLTPDVTEKAAVPTQTFEPYGTDNPSIIVNSNGSRGNRLGATSKGSSSGALPSLCIPTDGRLWIAMAVSVVGGAVVAGFLP
ncbi:glycoside hydrolase family 79 protein [Tilletiaria anomala UBC 951]|uniref:Glycoside hydrolase family 79 protein n=1 Tax=Tilletiaria anomala (strain ATCC 24038 / CBS 436.72 / UBC 951) TaxID=1037660 RepID=A0A066VRM5_TILAU|nr:glycoside hydrolase family 79 protein [Tilletiaria anomala UBC 951]KDN41240.1 glycoside hydrolase family 79 protein [Tilletiaria anomala UBC 951]